MSIPYEKQTNIINQEEVKQKTQKEPNNFYKDYVDKSKNKMYNETNEKTYPTVGVNSTAQGWLDKNKDSLKYAGDKAKKSIHAGLEDAHSFMKDADEGTSFGKVQDAAVKWRLASDANDKRLAHTARNEMIGHLSAENKEAYLKDAQPLQAYIDAKDAYDYRNSKYTTTENADKTPNEEVRQKQRELNRLGYTDKFGEPLKEDGVLAGKTQYALDKLKEKVKKEEKADEKSIRLQRSLNQLGYTGKDGNPLKEDGIVGENTQYALEGFAKSELSPILFDDTLDMQVVDLSKTDDPMMFEKFVYAGNPLDLVDTVVDKGKYAVSGMAKVVQDATSKITWENLFAARDQGVSYVNIKNAYFLSRDADKRAREYALKHDPLYSADGTLITWGNSADTYRHFTWNYEMAEILGYSQALKISSAHEIAYLRLHNLVKYTYTGDVYDRKAFMTPQMLMDVWNNLKGVNAYAEFKNQNYDYEKAYEILADRNELVSNEEETLKAYGFTQDDVTTEKIDGEELRGVWVYFNYKNGYITNIRKVVN